MITTGRTDLKKAAFAVELIEVTDAHSSVLAEIHQRAFDHPWPVSAFASLLKQPVVRGWIAAAGDPLGFLVVRQAADEAEILTIAVLPEQRRKTVARTLINHGLAILLAAGTIRLFLEVAADNEGAIALYNALGFTTTGRRTAYYKRRAGAVDAILMARDLNGPVL